MGDPTISTQKLTREQIAAIVGNNPRAIKLFENLVADVAVTLPFNIDQAALSSLFSLHGADGSKQAAETAMQTAQELRTVLHACARNADDLRTLRDEVQSLRLELHDARSRLSGAVQQAQRTASEALTLTSGV